MSNDENKINEIDEIDEIEYYIKKDEKIEHNIEMEKLGQSKEGIPVNDYEAFEIDDNWFISEDEPQGGGGPPGGSAPPAPRPPKGPSNGGIEKGPPPSHPSGDSVPVPVPVKVKVKAKAKGPHP